MFVVENINSFRKCFGAKGKPAEASKRKNKQERIKRWKCFRIKWKILCVLKKNGKLFPWSRISAFEYKRVLNFITFNLILFPFRIFKTSFYFNSLQLEVMNVSWRTLLSSGWWMEWLLRIPPPLSWQKNRPFERRWTSDGSRMAISIPLPNTKIFIWKALKVFPVLKLKGWKIPSSPLSHPHTHASAFHIPTTNSTK